MKTLSNPIERITIKIEHNRRKRHINRLTTLQAITVLVSSILIMLIGATPLKEFNFITLVFVLILLGYLQDKKGEL